MSSEPSMEEILSSIKKIIAEDGAADLAPRPRTGPRFNKPTALPLPEPEAMPAGEEPALEAADEEEILELSADHAHEDAKPEDSAKPAQAEELVSPATLSDARSALASLSNVKLKSEAIPQSDSLESLVRELLRPMMREWLDANLPQIVESMVAKEIERLSGR